MLHQIQNENYLGNPNVKRDGILQEWTKDLVQEYKLCMKDPVYFAEKYLKIISLEFLPASATTSKSTPIFMT